MSDNSKNKKNENFPMANTGNDCDCNPGECCPTDSTASGQSYKGLKTIVFIVVMLAAVAVGAYSLIGNQTDAGDMTAVIDVNPELDVLIASQSAYTSDLLGDDEFVYLTLGGAGAAMDENDRVNSLINDAAALIRKKGVKVKTISAIPGDPVFSQAVELFEVTSLPAVLAVKKDGGSVMVENEFTETNLLKAYLMANDPSSCAPGCDPKDCE